MRSVFKRLLGSLGFDLIKIGPTSSHFDRRMRLLNGHDVDLVIDIGANVGQYALEMRRLGFAGRIVSVEPSSAAFASLSATAARDPAWTALQLAIGERDGSATLNLSRNSHSSSLLPMLDSLTAIAPDAAYVATEVVPMRTLASLIAEHAQSGAVPFLKIDAQGYEQRILESGSAALAQVRGLQLELSLVPTYAGEAGFTELVRWLEARGFALMSIEPGMCDTATGRQLQVDGIFFRVGIREG